jgi:glycerophosphoryl diester phosphodiesterase
MNRFKTPLLLSIIVLLFSGCSQNKNDNANHKTRILGHRGNGIKGYNDTLMDNTIPAIIKAIQITDGVEVDIQMSLDETIWLYHDTYFLDSDSNSFSIPNLSDQQILIFLSKLHPIVKFNTLKELFEYFSNNQIKKVISLDIKTFYNENCFENTQASNNYQKEIGEKIIKLAQNYNLENQILIESDSKYLLDIFKKKSDMKTFLLGWSNFNNLVKIAKQKRYTGISHRFSDSEINEKSILFAHKKGLEIQLWTPNSQSDLEYILSLKPNYIQTDNTSYFKLYIPDQL